MFDAMTVPRCMILGIGRFAGRCDAYQITTSAWLTTVREWVYYPFAVAYRNP